MIHDQDLENLRSKTRAAADAVAFRRQGLIGSAAATAAAKSAPGPIIAPETIVESRAEGDKPLGFGHRLVDEVQVGDADRVTSQARQFGA